MVRGDLMAVKRLDGWKAIAGYFGRDRTTAMRWARDRNLPVRRMPGGKQGSIFAFEHELAAWAVRQDDLGSAPSDPQPAAESRPPSPGPAAGDAPVGARRRVRVWIPVVAVVGALLLAGAAWWIGPRSTGATPASPTVAMPRDPAVAHDYVAARDAWARRTPQDLATAVRLYEGVIRREPGFAPAHAGLAEAWLILREYGGADEASAYRAARRHAEQALRLDPDLAAAHRALGFIDYWWAGRTPDALNRFRRAIALDHRDSLSHFWYANMLADVGRDAEAQREYDTARLLSPGSRVIEVEQACSHWQAGRDALALEQLVALAVRAPDDATVFNCLAWAHIGRGDIAGYARALATRARLRREPRLLRVSADLDAAVRRDPATAVGVLIAEGRREIATGARKLRETPAFYASAMGDRAALVQLLTEASDQGEVWYAAALTRRIAARWNDDQEVRRLLARVLPPPGP